MFYIVFAMKVTSITASYVIPWIYLIKMDVSLVSSVSPLSRLFWYLYIFLFISFVKLLFYFSFNIFSFYWILSPWIVYAHRSPNPKTFSNRRSMAATTLPSGEPASEDTSLYPIAVLIDELKNEDVQVCNLSSFM